MHVSVITGVYGRSYVISTLTGLENGSQDVFVSSFGVNGQNKG